MKPTAVVGRRVGAFLIDNLIVLAFNAAVFFAFAQTDDELARKVLSGELDANASAYVNVTLGDERYSIVGGGAALYFLVSFLVGVGYWVVLQGRTGWTLGKRMLGIRLVRDDGSMPVGIWRSFVRQFLWIVDAFPYLIPYLTGFIAAKATARNKRIGDMVAGTLVVAKQFAGAPSSAEPAGPPAAPAPAPTPVPAAAEPSPPPDWYPDPHGEKRLRYWDGSAWTGQTAD